MGENAQLITANLITLVIDSEVYKVPSSHVSYQQIKWILLRAEVIDWEEIKELADAARAVQLWGNGSLTVIDGEICHNETPIHNVLTGKILQGMREGENVQPFVLFLENLLRNPSNNAINELYLFMEKAQLPLTEDGHFLAYKNVTEDYKDRHSRTFDNRVGQVCQIARQQVDDDRRNTCSYGLHFCALHYLQEMWGFTGRTMIVKINPADVVAIPYDYDNAKGRTCRYEVVAEVSAGERLEKNFSKKAIWTGDAEDEEELEDDSYASYDEDQIDNI